MTINGVGLFVADYGAEDALFVHDHGGGYHFQQSQGALLAQDPRVIAPDQRSVLRSDPVAR